MLGGMDFAGIPLIADVLGIDDIEWLVRMLIVIRDKDR